MVSNHYHNIEGETALLFPLVVVPRCVWNNNGYRLIFDISITFEKTG